MQQPSHWSVNVVPCCRHDPWLPNLTSNTTDNGISYQMYPPGWGTFHHWPSPAAAGWYLAGTRYPAVGSPPTTRVPGRGTSLLRETRARVATAHDVLPPHERVWWRMANARTPVRPAVGGRRVSVGNEAHGARCSCPFGTTTRRGPPGAPTCRLRAMFCGFFAWLLVSYTVGSETQHARTRARARGSRVGPLLTHFATRRPTQLLGGAGACLC